LSRTVQIAAVQMDANPAPASERLVRAERLVAKAGYSGAQLVVLPELFSVGYTYEASNYSRAEPLAGPSISWMKRTAAELGIHLAGSVLLREEGEIYNALLLWAPDGRMWRYDKVYPWAWERAFFRRGRGTMVADTDLGRIGLLICWDVGHRTLWRQYAGQVDLMVISSCPPNVADPTYYMPDGRTVSLDQLGPLVSSTTRAGERVFGDIVSEQVGWLGVPAVNAMGCGQIKTPVPNGQAMILGLAPLAPGLLRFLGQAGGLQMSCGMMPGCRVLDAGGQTVAAVGQEDGESVAVGQVGVPAVRPQPRGKQPATTLPWTMYLLSDVLVPGISAVSYRRNRRHTRQHAGV